MKREKLWTGAVTDVRLGLSPFTTLPVGSRFNFPGLVFRRERVGEKLDDCKDRSFTTYVRCKTDTEGMKWPLKELITLGGLHYGHTHTGGRAERAGTPPR